MEIAETKSINLSARWESLQQERPGVRIRDAAKVMGVSEAALLATKTGEDVIRLHGPWPTLLQRFKELGRVMSLTRNDACILEHKGSFQSIDIIENGAHAMATVIGPIETRVFFAAWTFAFAVTETKSDRILKSIQVFDKAGDAITKIYLQEGSNEEAFNRIISDFRASDQSENLKTTLYSAEEFNDQPNDEALLSDWASLKDTHEYFGMLRRHKVRRYDAMEIAKGKFTTPLDAQLAPLHVLEKAAAAKLPIMIFAGNRGNIQIHQGKVRTVRVLERGHTGPERWLNILDPDFNMHLKQNDIATAWLVTKPTTDGIVTSVELFDNRQEMVVQFFGLRKPGIPEREEWTTLVNTLVPASI
ncbi:ChuX/HutX family heme-like substrate-binding protein [Chryseolinea sp. T2]|uniref:hemin-degrading factor n=1 Tax=Chryseolinea sp. T2 TaxID=3129255 RepID=UPI0030788FA7